MSIFNIIVGFIFLVLGGEFLVRSSVGISFKLKVSKIIIGMTVVSFATSLPELIVSIQSALQGHTDIALSNVIGSNIANIALVMGVTAIVSPLIIGKTFKVLDWPIMMIFSLLLWYFLYNDHMLSRFEGFLLFTAIVTFVIVLVRKAKKDNVDDDIDEALATASFTRIVLWLTFGGLGLWLGSIMLVKGAVEIAHKLDVSERVIGISMIAIGTSIPELAASLIAALKDEKSISIGNLIGSNIFNIGSVLGITALINPITHIDEGFLSKDLLWMLAIAAILIPLILIPHKMKIGRIKGVFLVVVYLVFLYISFK